MWAKVEGASVTEIIPRPKAMTIGDVQYPRNIFELWTSAELKGLGIYPVTLDNTNWKDTDYYSNTAITYTFSSGTVTGAYGTATAKALADLKTSKKSGINHQANSLLSQYDWYTLRVASGGTAIPSSIATYQAAVRTAANSMCTKIDAASDVDALAALFVYTGTPPTRSLGNWPDKPE